MATLSESIYSRLTDVASATYALAGLRVYPVQAARAAQAPFVVWQEIASSAAETHDDVQGLDEVLIQFSCYAQTVKAAEALRRAVRADLVADGAIAGVKVTGPVQRMLLEEELDPPFACAQLDLTFWHVPTQT